MHQFFFSQLGTLIPIAALAESTTSTPSFLHPDLQASNLINNAPPPVILSSVSDIILRK